MLRRAAAAVGLVAAMVLLAGCTSETPSRPTPSSSPDPVAVTAAPGDGTLRMATVLAMSPEAAPTSAAVVAGVELAVREIDEQGGALDAEVTVIHRDAAADPAALGAELAARGIDVVLWGPASEVPEALSAAIAPVGATIVRLPDVTDASAVVTPDDGFAARLRSADPGLSTLAGGAEGYDAVVRVALAATRSGDDSGLSVAAGLPAISSGAFACTSWGECAAALADGASITYVGPTGEPATS